MKIIFIFLVLFIFSNSYIQAQSGWNDEVETYIDYLNEDERIAIFANHYGIHVLRVLYTGDNKHVRYFRLTSEGEQPSGFPSAGKNLDDYGDYPNIVGDETIMYVVYRQDNTIQVQKSTDGGDNWSSIDEIEFENTSATNCNGVDAAYTSGKGLHVVWSEKVSGNYESYFKLFNGIIWRSTENITNSSPVNNGGFPTVTTSNVSSVPRTHVTINTGNADWVGNNLGDNYNRDYDYTDWSDPLEIHPSTSQGQSKIDRLLVTEDGNIHSFYYKWISGLPSFQNRKKTVTGSSWGTEKEIDATLTYTNNTHKLQVTKTVGDASGNKVHAFWINPESPQALLHKKKYSPDENWPSSYDILHYSVQFRDVSVTSVSNDLFIVWSLWTGEPIYYYLQYDDVPLAPQGLAVESYEVENQTYAKLTWAFNNEPDVKINDDGYLIERRTKPYGGSWSDWSQIAAVAGTTKQYIDYDITNIGADKYTAEYKIRAKDVSNNISPYSSTVSITFGQFSKLSVETVIYEYYLGQNYPNPFNPTTQISYSIAEDAFVLLKVYDMLGNEVAELVNSNQTAGNYETNFNASKLSSGIYIYRITVMNGERILFSESKQMVLMK